MEMLESALEAVPPASRQCLRWQVGLEITANKGTVD